jgi:uncharacterized protein involved in exopolysaccharide biosynthesis
MNQGETVASGMQLVPEAKQISILDMMIALAKHKKLILGLPVAGAALAGAIAFALPNVYKAGTVLLPPQQQQSSASALLSQLGGMAGMAAGAAGLKNPNDVYIGMLKSRTIADKLVGRFDLKSVYDTDSLEKARKRLAEKSAIAAGKDGLITIEVESGDAKLSSRMANAYVEELLQLSRVLAVTEAGQRRVFFEGQLELAKNNLAKAEASLKGSLDTRGVVSVDGESRAVVETVARLKAQVSMKEIEINSMRAFVTTSHPEYQRAVEELSSLRAELSKLENGRGADIASDDKGGNARGLENIQRLRDLKYYQMLYELLAKQYEAARLDEAKDPSLIQVLDKAVEPERPVRPQHLLIVLLGTLAGLFLAVLMTFVAEFKNKALQEPLTKLRWTELKSLLGRK